MTIECCWTSGLGHRQVRSWAVTVIGCALASAVACCDRSCPDVFGTRLQRRAFRSPTSPVAVTCDQTLSISWSYHESSARSFLVLSLLPVQQFGIHCSA